MTARDPMPTRCSGCCQHINDCDCPGPFEMDAEIAREARILDECRKIDEQRKPSIDASSINVRDAA